MLILNENEMKKLNVLLAVTDALKGKYKRMVEDFTKFFNSSQGAFLGEKSTYIPKEGTVDEPSKRKYVKVVTTVDEKIDWFVKESKDFVDALFAQEKTNASGIAKAKLKVDGKDWGEFTSLELLRLKTLLESGDAGNLENMLNNIPVRPDSQIWEDCSLEEYTGRNIFQSPLIGGVSKTTVKEEYILDDPNISKLSNPNSYTPKTSIKTITMDIGDYTTQSFTGQWSHRQRAMALKRRNDLLTAVIGALKECNECDVVESNLNSEKIFNYIFRGE
jgi:hypothetical protein